MMKAVGASLEVQQFSRLFKALGDETRLRIIGLLAHEELCVCHVEEALELPQPTVSRHLGILKSAGLVESRRQGTWTYYRLASHPDPDCSGLLAVLTSSFSKQDQLREYVQRLAQTRGPQSCP